MNATVMRIQTLFIAALATTALGLLASSCTSESGDGGGTPTSPSTPSPAPQPAVLTVVTTTGVRIPIEPSSLLFTIGGNDLTSYSVISHSTCAASKLQVREIDRLVPVEDTPCGVTVCGTNVGCGGESWKLWVETSGLLSGYYQTATNSQYGIRYTRTDTGAREFLPFRNLQGIEWL